MKTVTTNANAAPTHIACMCVCVIYTEMPRNKTGQNNFMKNKMGEFILLNTRTNYKEAAKQCEIGIRIDKENKKIV